MDATVLKIRVDRVVKNIAAYIMLGITLEGKKEILGIWIGENECKNRSKPDNDARVRPDAKTEFNRTVKRCSTGH